MKHFRWLPAGILVLLWWGVLFPETALTQDAYRVLDAKGNEIELSEEDRKEVYGKLLQADPSQVKYKSILWEWLQELKDEDYEEEGMKKQAKIKVTGTSVIEGEELVTGSEYEKIIYINCVVDVCVGRFRADKYTGAVP